MSGWAPSRPMTLAETHVDFPGHHALILTERRKVEQAALATARKLAVAVVDLHGLPPAGILGDLERSLDRSLMRTARYGYTQAQREVRSLRAQPIQAAAHPEHTPATLAALATLVGVKVGVQIQTINQRVQKAASDGHLRQLARAELVLQVMLASQRALHNSVLELVGQTLNLGRSLGVAELPASPQLAMRSEQLDGNTCEVCDSLHGTVVEVDSPEYDDLMPPSECLGGGRCRGIFVYADDQAALELPEAA